MLVASQWTNQSAAPMTVYSTGISIEQAIHEWLQVFKIWHRATQATWVWCAPNMPLMATAVDTYTPQGVIF